MKNGKSGRGQAEVSFRSYISESKVISDQEGCLAEISRTKNQNKILDGSFEWAWVAPTMEKAMISHHSGSHNFLVSLCCLSFTGNEFVSIIGTIRKQKKSEKKRKIFQHFQISLSHGENSCSLSPGTAVDISWPLTLGHSYLWVWYGRGRSMESRRPVVRSETQAIDITFYVILRNIT